MSALSIPPRLGPSNVLRRAPSVVYFIGLLLIVCIWWAAHIRQSDMFQETTNKAQANVTFAVQDMSGRLRDLEDDLSTDFDVIQQEAQSRGYYDKFFERFYPLLTSGATGLTSAIYGEDGSPSGSPAATPSLPSSDISLLREVQAKRQATLLALTPRRAGSSQVLRYGEVVYFQDGVRFLTVEVPVSSVLPSAWMERIAPDYEVVLRSKVNAAELRYAQGLGAAPTQNRIYSFGATSLPDTVHEAASVNSRAVASL